MSDEIRPETGAAAAIEVLEGELETPMLLVTVSEPESGRMAEAEVSFRDVAARGVEVSLVDSVVRAWEQLGREGAGR